jgi:predicted ATPase/class 3 adenylate cyclase/DNA-binding XRE family transcriptional regulator
MAVLFSFGAWLKQRRSALLLSRDELAQQVGCAEITLRKIEADERRPSLAVAERLADLLELTGDERTLFLQVARGLLGADRLPPPIPRGAAPPAPSVAPAPVPSLPSGTVTFLFTDIAGSTKLWEQHPQAMPSALARHDALLRQTITAHGGGVFKTVGDAVCAAFARAPDALTAALAAQRALQAEDWGAIGPLRMRVALHTGVADERAGDYFGPPLNRAARLLSAGHGTQTLLSLATAELVREHLPPDVALRDLGPHRLKDLSRPEQIFQLVAPDLPADFPALHTLDARRTNLPAQSTPLIGRERELAALGALAQRADVRLVTLTGPGGTGKTRLGLHVTAELLDTFADGAYFVDLAPISDAALVGASIAQTLSVPETAGQAILATLKVYLRARHTLLLLDNFEQVLDAAPLVAELLAAAPQLKVLITSRTTLHLSSEHEFNVPPLAVPPLAPHSPSPSPARGEGEPNPPLSHTGERGPRGEGDLTQYAAVQLFIARAQAALADFTVTNATAPALAEICVRLDGLPLAIELAAARIKLFPPEQLLARLGQRLALLTGGPRDRPARQQTLRNTIDWSYQLLSPAEQTLFRRLSVFVGGCTMEAAIAVMSSELRVLSDSPHNSELKTQNSELETLDGLAALVDQSLLRQSASAGGASRFVMLETIREYALGRLEDSDEADAVRRQHAAYFLALAEEDGPAGGDVHPKAWLDQMALEHDNLRAALAWAFGGGDVELGCRLVVALNTFWDRAYWNEGWRWREAALEQSSGVAPSIRAMLLLQAGMNAWQNADWEPARTRRDEALALFRAAGDRSGIAGALHALGMYADDDAQAATLFEASLALYRELGDQHGIAGTLHHLGDAVRDQGDTARGAALLEESLALHRELGDTVGVSNDLNGLGDVACGQGDYLRALALYWESVALIQPMGHRAGLLWPLRNLGWMALVLGDDGRVQALLQEYVGWSRDKAALTSLAWLIHILGALVNAQGDAAQATALLREGLILQQQFGLFSADESLEAFAGVAAGQNQPARAARLLGAIASMQRSSAAQAAYDHVVTTVRSQLDEAAFAAAWAEGQALSREQAVAEALGDGDRAAGEP